MLPALSIAAAVLAFFAVALILSRRGLHRSLETMPLLAGERTLLELRDLTLTFEKGDGRGTRVTYRGCVARVTSSRLLIAQQLGSSGQNRLVSVVLSRDAEAAMRLVDADAIDRALKSFSVCRVDAEGLTTMPDGTLSMSLAYLGPIVALPNPPRWHFPSSAGSSLGDALRDAGVC